MTMDSWGVWDTYWGLLEQTDVTTRGKSTKRCLEAQKLAPCASKKGDTSSVVGWQELVGENESLRGWDLES